MDKCGAHDHDGFLQAAQRYLAGNRYEEALDLSRERLKEFPGDPEALMVVCRAWLGLDDLEEAQAALAALDKLHLRLAGLYRALGDACLERGRDREAVAYFLKGLQLLPDAVAVRQLAQIGMDDPDASGEGGADEESAQDGHAVGPDFYTVTLADLYEQQGHLELAAEVLEAVGRREPHNEEVRRRLDHLRAVMGILPETPSPAELPPEPEAAVVEELSRWLSNLDRIRSDIASADHHA